ncbi:hypothetical protein JXR93_01020 [bacterium]|nr:hypothetical protein [bacterium]
MERIRLGEFLEQKGLVTKWQLDAALQEQKNFGTRLGEILVNHGYLSEGELIEAVAEWKNIKFVDLSEVPPSKTAISMMTSKFCKDNIVYPVRFKSENNRNILFLAMTDTFNLALMDEIKFQFNIHKIEPILASSRAIEACIQRDYDLLNIVIPSLSYEKRANYEASIDDDLEILTSTDKKSNDSKTNSSIEVEELQQQIVILKGEVELLKDSIKGYKKYFNNLIKILVKKGMITKEEYLNDLKES